MVHDGNAAVAGDTHGLHHFPTGVIGGKGAVWQPVSAVSIPEFMPFAAYHTVGVIVDEIRTGVFLIPVLYGVQLLAVVVIALCGVLGICAHGKRTAHEQYK